MIALAFAATAATMGMADAPPSPPPQSSYTVSDAIGRNPDDVCMLAYRSGHWSDWLAEDAKAHHAGRSAKAMFHYCDGFVHGMQYKGQ